MKSRVVRLSDIEWPHLPQRWRQVLIPAEVPGLARDIVSLIHDQVPEYRRSLEGPYGRAIRRGVEGALTTFVGQVTRTGTLSPAHLEVFRSLGRNEALAGHSHDALQSSYRLGSMLAWRRIMRLNETDPLPPATIAALAAAVFGFVDHLAAVSAAGYAEAELTGDELTVHRRARLLQLLLDQPASPAGAIRELATQLGWELPDEVTVIALDPGADVGDAELARMAGQLTSDGRALGGRTGFGCALLVPGPLGEPERQAVAQFSAKAELAVGATVPLSIAATSLRWAQQAARLAATGAIADPFPIYCDQHLPELLMQAEKPLFDQLIRRRLAPLAELSSAKRLKYARLLSTWLEHGCSQGELAGLLGVHRQTVHYQASRLQNMFGDQLRDPTARVELILALRAALPDWSEPTP